MGSIATPKTAPSGRPAYYGVCVSSAAKTSKEPHVDLRKDVEAAIAINPRNATLTMPVRGLNLGRNGLSGGPLQLAIFTSTLWQPGSKLNVGFSGGTEWQRTKVRTYAPLWCLYANIGFNFDATGPLDILISFIPDAGSWSYLGTQSRAHASANDPSMNLGWINESNSEAELQSVILHEFGHSLGAVHEHESPVASIPWNKPEVYKDLGGPPNNWSQEKVDQNMFTVYSTEDVQSSFFDPDSVMLYFFPPSWTLDNKGTKNNTQLSLHDQSYIRFCYPVNAYDAGVLNTMQLRSWTAPAATNETECYFYKKWSTPPTLAWGLNYLDIASSANIRIQAVAKDLKGDRFTAGLNSWADTTQYAAGMTYLEVSRFPLMQTGSFNTNALHPWNQPQQQNAKRINFAQPYEQAPKVVCFFTTLDMSNAANWRAKVYADAVDTRGFTIHINTWADTTLFQAEAMWLAHPVAAPKLTSGRFSTTDVRPWDQPTQDTSTTKNFGMTFATVPKVFMALDEIDYKNGSNLRFRLSLSLVTNQAMTWHLQTWADSTLFAAGASYLAWESGAF